MAKTICGVQLEDKKKSKDFMLMMDLNEATNQLATANSVD